MSLRFAAFDIETTALDATYGRILCACFKFSDEDAPRTISAYRYKDEPRALEEIAKTFEAADVVVTWNGKRFDIPFVNARLMVRRREHRIKPAILEPTMKHIDLMYMCKKLRTRGSSMDGAAKDLRVDNQKFNVSGEHWIRAADGDKESHDLIAKHCQLDVLMTEELTKEFRPYIVRITR